MPIRDAVSAVFAHDRQLFVIKRQERLLAFPGYCAFPGGKVDRDESDAPFESGPLSVYPPRLMRALCRELVEELGFDLEEAVRHGLAANISELGVATTPDIQSHRFRTHFFKIDLARPYALEADAQEAAESGWRRLEDLDAAYESGRLLAVPPAVRIIKALRADVARTTVPDVDFSYDPDTEVPCFETVKGLWQAPTLSNTLLPATRTNAFVVGDTLVDPSPRSSEEKTKLMNTLRRFSIAKIFLTHHHADHYEFADAIAAELGAPIWLSADSHERIAHWRPGYFRDLETKLVGEGDTLTQWLGRDVKLYAVPGHDEGQLAPAPETMEWFIVGDLIQGVGTVVIASPEGDMRKYFQSLQRVIELEPAVIIPSHGGAMGGVHRLRETLKHRRMRERQVLELHQNGVGKQHMLEEIYTGLDPRLSPFAMANIESHLAKLRLEKRI